MRDAAIDPDVDGVVAFRCAFRKSEFAREISIAELEPDIRAALGDKVGEFANPIGVEGGALVYIEDRQGHAPAPLARDHPVGARFHGTGNAIFAPGRHPSYVVMNGIERFAADLIQADKELFDRAKDNRRFRAPAIGISVLKILFGQEHAFVAQNANDVGVGVENIFADQFRNPDLVSIAAVIVNWRKNGKTVFRSEDVIVFAMARRDMDGARAGIHGNEPRSQNHNRAREKRVLRADAFEFVAGK